MNATGSDATIAATGRVLVADDEESTRLLLRDLLEAQGHEVAEAVNGEQALAAARNNLPDLIILDVLMPKSNGMEVCRRLKSESVTASVPVLLVTSLADRQDRIAGIEAGANDFLTKPIDTQDVALRVRNGIRTKRLYDQLAENYRQLRTLEALRDDLTRMIVHDLRTPLSSLISGLQTLPVVGPLNETQRECLDIAVQEGNGLLGMIGDLLDIGKMEAGVLQLDYQDLEPGELVEAATRQVARLADEKRLTIRSDVPEYLPTFSGDREKLQRTLTNLLGNAVKFTPDGGAITVSARYDEPGMAMRFEVSDTGPGIPSEAFERIFQKFEQVPTPGGSSTRSTGLGLAFCRMAVEAHGGRIWVESDPGKGSTFRFTIPLEPRPVDACGNDSAGNPPA